MNIVFTICSNNYLARAKVVSDTFLKHNPGYTFFIFLVDKLNEKLDYSIIEPVTIIPIENIVQDIDELALKYDIVELNTSVKPSVFLYLFKTYNSNIIIYLDPDLMIFDHFGEVEDALISGNQNIVISPHFLSPIDDGKIPSEIDFNLYGVFNLGFIALKNNSSAKSFLEWWHNRLMKYCFALPHKGMFTDQIWINYAPVFFTGVFILKHSGYNVANWNLYERKLCIRNNTLFVNEDIPVKFFHFSHYDFADPYRISKKQTRHTIEGEPELKLLIDTYQHQLLANKAEMFMHLPSAYAMYQNNQKKQLSKHTVSRKISDRIRITLRTLLYGHI